MDAILGVKVPPLSASGHEWSSIAIRHSEDERKLFDEATNIGFFLWGDARQDERQIVGVRVLLTLDDQLLHARRAASQGLFDGGDRGLVGLGDAAQMNAATHRTGLRSA